MGAVIALERQKLEDLRQIDTSVTNFRSRLTGRQLAAGIADDFAPHALALHDRLFAWRHGRYWR